MDSRSLHKKFERIGARVQVGALGIQTFEKGTAILNVLNGAPWRGLQERQSLQQFEGVVAGPTTPPISGPLSHHPHNLTESAPRKRPFCAFSL
jgi:hypothetical protein